MPRARLVPGAELDDVIGSSLELGTWVLLLSLQFPCRGFHSLRFNQPHVENILKIASVLSGDRHVLFISPQTMWCDSCLQS